MKIAKAKGRLCGKQPKLNPRQEAHLVELFETGEHSTAELADLFGVGRSTVYRALESQQISDDLKLCFRPAGHTTAGRLRRQPRSR